MRHALLAATLATAAAPVAAQHHDMPGMTMPMPKAAPAPVAKKPVRKPGRTIPRKPAASAAPPMEALPMAHGAMAMDHAAMDHATPDRPVLGTDLPAGKAPAPAAVMPDYADRFWNPAEMARGRAAMMRDEGGGRTFAQVMVDLAEYQVRAGHDGYRWDGEGWFGGDIDRLAVKTEGEGTVGGRVDAAEVQALYSRAIDPYFNLQAGLRQDIRPTRTYATVGIEGLAPYWFEVGAAAFLSTRGELLARVEGHYDQRLTQRMIVQPRVELNLSAQDVRATRTGAGLSTAEAGIRLRYEIRREFAPYIGVSWESKLGDTARFARAAGEDSGGFSVVAGVRAWF